jgi:hypothetical protein
MSYTNPCQHGREIRDGHLGGTCLGGDPDSYFPELWDWLISKFQVEHVLDVGCGLGYAMQFFDKRDIPTIGIEGCAEVLSHHLLPDRVLCHDYTKGRYQLGGLCWDLVWCCEFAEHIEARFENYFLDDLAEAAGKVLAFCAAPPGAGGHHHVNCQGADYWIARLEGRGLRHEPELTQEARSFALPGTCGRAASYFHRSGLLFTSP